MKITGVESLATGAKKSESKEVQFVNLDDSEDDDDCIEVLESEESKVVDPKMEETEEADFFGTPNSVEERPASPCDIYDDLDLVINNVTTAKTPKSGAIEKESPEKDPKYVLEFPGTPDSDALIIDSQSQSEIVSEPPASPATITNGNAIVNGNSTNPVACSITNSTKIVVESPASPDSEAMILETPEKPTAIPDDSMILMESPSSPLAVSDSRLTAVESSTTIPSAQTSSVVSDGKEIFMESPASPPPDESGVQSSSKSTPIPNGMKMAEESESPASPDVVVVLEPPASPPSSSSCNPDGHMMKIRVEETDAVPSGVVFSLDSEGDKTSVSSSQEKTDTENFGTFHEVPSIGGSSDFTSSKKQSLGERVPNPLYTRLHSKGVLGDETAQKDQKSDDDAFPSANIRRCFNCLGDHAVRDCPEPHDRVLINQRLQDFRSSQTREKNTRYHETSLQERFAEFKPGVISDDLRIALGVQRDRLPKYIWKMREHGYPPGWLRQAAEASTQLKFYDNDVVRKERSEAEMRRLLKANLPEYKGFTSPVPPGYKDDGEWYGTKFNDQHTTESIATKYLQRQGAGRAMQQISTSRGNRGDHPPRGSGNATFIPGRAQSPSATFIPNREQSSDGKQGLNSANNQTPSWYSEVCGPSRHRSAPSPQGPKTSDMKEVDHMYERIVMGRRTSGPDYWDETHVEGPHNYRHTEELERQVEERKKLMAIRQKSLEIEKRPRKAISRPSSPSLLSPERLKSSWRSNSSFPPAYNPRAGAADDDDEDDDIVIIDEQKPGPSSRIRPLKRPLEEDVICLSSDDEEETNSATTKSEENGMNSQDDLLPNPLFKKLKTSHDAHDQRPLPTAPNNATMSKKEYDQDTEMHRVPNEAAGSDSMSMDTEDTMLVTENAKDNSIGQEQLLDILAKHSDKAENLTYGDLPPIDNFSKGMPELPLQEEATEFSGRLQKVLGIIHEKKANQKKATEFDDDIQIIE